MDGGAPRFGFPPRLMRAKAAAYYLGMSETAFRDRVAAEVEPIRSGGMVLYDRADLDAWVDRQRPDGTPSSPEANPWLT